MECPDGEQAREGEAEGRIGELPLPGPMVSFAALGFMDGELVTDRLPKPKAELPTRPGAVEGPFFLVPPKVGVCDSLQLVGKAGRPGGLGD